MLYHVKSFKKNGTYFGRFKSLDDAQEAADKAILEEKYGADDWEPEEKDLPGLNDVAREKDLPGLDAVAAQDVNSKGRYSKQLVNAIHDAFNALSNAAGIAGQDNRSAVQGIIRGAMDVMKKVITAWKN